MPELVALDDAQPITVDPLPAAESLRLLGSLLGTARVAAEPAAAQRLVGLCGGLPLALRMAAAELVGQPQVRLADIVTGLPVGTGPEPGRDLAIAVAGPDPARDDRPLVRADAGHRPEPHDPGRYRFHELVAEYARRRAADTLDPPACDPIRMPELP
jgi:hypothetical protein